MLDNFFKYGENIEWSLPFLFQNEPLYGVMYNTCKEYEINLPKANIFGSPKCAWDGGRCSTVFQQLDSKTILRIFGYVTELNAIPALTFSRTNVTKDDLDDEYSNLILDIALEIGAKFIVCSDILKDYIREKKADAHIISSVIKPVLRFHGKDKVEEPTFEVETNFYNKLLKEYDMVVVRPEYCEALAEAPEAIDDISRIEVLINQVCIKDCPKMPDHYRYYENYDLSKMTNEVFECSKMKYSLSEQMKNTTALRESTINKLCSSGVKHLKLEGRGIEVDIIQLMYLTYVKMFDFYGVNSEIIKKINQLKLNEEINRYQNFLANDK